MRVSPIMRVFLAGIVALLGLSLIASATFAQPAPAPVAQAGTTTPAATTAVTGAATAVATRVTAAGTAVATTTTGSTTAAATPRATTSVSGASGATAASTPSALPTTGAAPAGDSSFLVLIGVVLLLAGLGVAIYRPSAARR